jgi:hypothetical protein
MVEVRGPDDLKALGLGDLTQHEQQRDRVGAARQRNSDAATAWQ